jgi:hypothetical protein
MLKMETCDLLVYAVKAQKGGMRKMWGMGELVPEPRNRCLCIPFRTKKKWCNFVGFFFFFFFIFRSYIFSGPGNSSSPARVLISCNQLIYVRR